MTHEQLKAYKSLEKYNNFINGRITGITVTVVLNARPKPFTALVRHSQCLFLLALKVWVSIKQNGEILCAHCTCMAELGEAHSHIAAVLFTAEANTKTKASLSSTSMPCS